MQDIAIKFAQQLALKMRDENRHKLVLGDDSPPAFTELVRELERDSGDAKAWVFSDRELGLPRRTLAIHEYPWGTTEARLLTSTGESEQSGVSAAIADLRAIQF